MQEFESFQTGWEVGWISLENIWQEIAGFASIWKRGMKNLKERRGLRRELANLLKNLKDNGLSQYRSQISTEVEDKFSFLFMTNNYVFLGFCLILISSL